MQTVARDVLFRFGMKLNLRALGVLACVAGLLSEARAGLVRSATVQTPGNRSVRVVRGESGWQLGVRENGKCIKCATLSTFGRYEPLDEADGPTVTARFDLHGLEVSLPNDQLVLLLGESDAILLEGQHELRPGNKFDEAHVTSPLLTYYRPQRRPVWRRLEIRGHSQDVVLVSTAYPLKSRFLGELALLGTSPVLTLEEARMLPQFVTPDRVARPENIRYSDEVIFEYQHGAPDHSFRVLRYLGKHPVTLQHGHEITVERD